MSSIYKNKTGLVRSSVLKAGRFLTMLVFRSLTKKKSLCCSYYSLIINFFIFHFNLVFYHYMFYYIPALLLLMTLLFFSSFFFVLLRMMMTYLTIYIFFNFTFTHHYDLNVHLLIFFLLWVVIFFM